jgi:hypothetical protein
MTRLPLLLALLTGCYEDLSNEGTACLVPEGTDAWDALDDTVDPDAEPVLQAGVVTEVLVILDECHSSSVRDEHAACTSTTGGSTVTVSSEGGYGPPIGAQNDDCNMLAARCPGPTLTDGEWTLDYAGRSVTFSVPSDTAPCTD